MLKNLVRTLTVILALSFVTPVIAQLKTESIRQINLLIQEKNSRTPAQKKMDSRLLQAAREKRGLQMVQGVDLEPAKINEESDGRVKVDINADVTDELINKIRSLGGTIIFPSKQYHTLRASINLSAAEIIAGYDEVKFIQPAVLAYTVGSGTPAITKKNDVTQPVFTSKGKRNASPLIRPSLTDRKQHVREAIRKYLEQHTVYDPYSYGSGAANSQGDHSHRADDARNRWGYAGQGIKIGVLSDSYNRLGGAAADVLNADLPGVGNPYGNTTPVTVVQDFTTSGNDEGRAMLQIIHDLAPKAQLYFATGNVSEASFATNIVALRNTYGCDIVIDDLGYYDEPAFQDGIVAQAVSTVTSSGGMYFSSAGNEGSVALGTAGVFEGDFNDAGSTFTVGAKAGSVHNFGTSGSPVNGDIITAVNTTSASASNIFNLQWSDPWGASSNDYDLFLVSSTGAVKSSSTTVQSGTQNPYEIVAPTGSTFAAGDRLVVFKTSTAQVRAFHLNTNRGRLTVATTGQTHGHSCVVDAYCVAATPATGVPFVGSNTVESFSSDGLRRIFYNVNGTEVTPGNVRFSTNGGTVRNKPDVTAADGVSTTLPASTGLNPFFGTSAAAPHAGAIAALLKSANPAITPAQVRTVLTGSAVDIQTVGYDNVSGSGILRAYDAMQQLNPSGLPYINLGTTTFSEGSTSNSNGSIEPGETGNLVVQLNNSSLVSASNVVATITSTTPGVTITQGSSNYGTINSSASATNTATPFTFGVSSSVACGTVISFQIKVAFDGGVGTVGYTVTTTVGQLFTVGNISSTLGSPPTAGAGYTVTSGQQTGRLVRGSAASTCAVPVANPGLQTNAGARQYDAYTFTNSTGASRCYTVTLSSSNGANIYTAAYNSSGFVPSNPGTNYIAEPGQSGTTQTYSFTIAAGSAFTVVVHDINVTPASNSPYTLSVTYIGCAAPPACATITVGPPTIASGATGTPYTQSFTASGGSGSYTFSESGTLPSGLTFSGNTLSGTPLQPGTYPITITAADGLGCSGSKNYSLVITGSTAPIVTVNPGNNNYLTVKDAFDAINAGTHTGIVTVNINGSTTETAPAVLNASGTGSASYTSVLIHPSVTGLSVSGNFATNGVIELNDADNVTIDGSTTGGTATAVGGDAGLRNLTVKNTSTTATAGAVIAVKQGTNGAQNVTIKNIIVSGQDPTQTLIGIQIGGNTIGTEPTVNNNNITVENCDVQKTFFGIYDPGVTGSPATGHIIRRNNLSSTGVNRIRRVGIVFFNQDGILVTENRVGGIAADENADAIGIAAGIQNVTTTATASGGIINSTISKNILDGIASVSANAYSASGIAIAGGTGTNSIINNMVSGIIAPSTDPDIVAGIFVAGVTGSSTNLFYNTVSLSGDRGSVAGQIGSYGIAISGTNPTVTLKDNIFTTTQTSAGGANAKSYALGMATTTFTNLTSDYNDYFFSGANAAGFRSGSLAATGTDYATLLAWQTATGKDAHSVNVAPVFVSPTDLHIVFGSNPGIDNKGTPITSPAITTDIDGDTRNVTTPDIGADEVSAPICTNVHNTNTLKNYCTIQAAIDDPLTVSGNIITVDAGIYKENITVNKELSIRGANYGVNACSGNRGAESIIQPATSDYANGVVISVTSPNVTFDGFTVDGDNTALTSGTVSMGADIDADLGIYSTANNTKVDNNIVKNIFDFGIMLDGTGSTGWSGEVKHNKLTNIPDWAGVTAYENYYAAIEDNCMTNVWEGVLVESFYLAKPAGATATVLNNTVTSGTQSFTIAGTPTTYPDVRGIRVNLHYSAASPWNVSNNAFANINTGGALSRGIQVLSMQSATSLTLSNNNVTGYERGYDLWNNPTSNTITVTGGTITGCTNGVFPNNYDGYGPSNAESSTYVVDGVIVTGGTNGIYVKDNKDNTNGATVSVQIKNNTTVIGSTTALRIEGADASANFSGATSASFNGNTVYINEVTNGTDVPASNIDATTVNFGGQTGATATLAQNYAIEDKIVHKIDNSALGFVLVKANNDFVTTNSFIAPSSTTPSIQRGVNAASNGFIVNVSSGTFNDQITVGKNITLNGANAGVDGVTGVRNAETILTSTASCISLATGNTLTVDGFQFNGRSFVTGNTSNSLAVNNCRITTDAPDGSNCIYVGQPFTNFTVQNNDVVITGNCQATIQPVGNYTGSGSLNTVNISGNRFTTTVASPGDGVRPVAVNLADVQGNVSANNFDGVDIGVLVANGSGNLTIEKNTFNALVRSTSDHSTNSFGAGVVLFQLTASAKPIDIVNNYFQNSDVGVRTSATSDFTSHPVNIHNNSLNNNQFYNLRNTASAGTFGATCNWYGTNDATVIASKIQGPVTYEPWLTSGTDTNPAPGFQPTASCNGTAADNDGDDVPNASDCAPFDPSNTTQKPKLNTSINSVVVNSNNDNVSDSAAFSVANTTSNIVFNYFTDAYGRTGSSLRGYQIIQTTNLNVPFCNNCSIPLTDFAGQSGTAALIDPYTPGTLVMKFVAFFDDNNNSQLDLGECRGDTVIYTITINPTPHTDLYVNDNNPAGDTYTTGLGNDGTGSGSPSNPYRTITKALSVASAGNTIYVDAGTYTENVIVNKGVTIRGAGSALTTIYPLSSDPVGSGGTLGASNIFLVQANNVTIDSLTANGDNPANGVGVDARNGIVTDFNSGDYTNLTVHHTTVTNIYWRGIYSAYGSTPGNTFNFHHNTVSNVTGDPLGSIAMFNFGNSGIMDNNTVTNALDGIVANQSTGTMFTNNTVTGIGIHTDNNGGSGGVADTIRKNTVSNISGGGYGILVFMPSRNVIVDRNLITNVDIALGNVGQGAPSVTPVFSRNRIDGQNKANSTGVFQATSYPGFTPANVSGSYINNFINNNQQGFYLKHESGFTSTIAAHENSVTGNTTSIALGVGPDGAGTLNNDFSCNWYGGPAPTVTGGSINYQPTLVDGTDSDGDATNGFQPVAGACRNCTTPDNTPPTITLKASPTVFLDAVGHYTVQLSDVLQSVTDNCDPNPTASVNSVMFDCSNLGSGGTPTAHQAYVSDKTAGNSSYLGEIGLEFSVNAGSSIAISKLGAFDDQANGFKGGVPGINVGIFNKATQALVASTLVVDGDPITTGNYRVHTLSSPVTLMPGNYVLVVKGYNPSEQYYNRQQSGPLNPAGDGAGGAVTFTNRVDWGANSSSGGFTYPPNSADAGNPNEYITGTFIYSSGSGASNTVTVTAKDVSNNQSQASIAVTVVDTFYNLITKDITVNLNGSGNATIQPSDVLASLKNFCGVDVTNSTLQLSRSNFNCSDVGGSSAPSSVTYQAYVSNKTAGNASYLGEIGLEFSVNAPEGIIINKLGAFDDQANGFKGGVPGINVGIFNKANQTLVPGLSALVVDGDPITTGNYRVHSLPSAVTLMPGNYIMVVKGYNPSEPYYNRQQSGPLNPAGDGAGGAVTFTNRVDWGANSSSGGFTYPPNSADAGNPNEYITGTFLYNTVVSGGTTVTLTATDVYGHQKSATAKVIVKDNTGPTIITKNITVHLNSSGQASITPNDVLQSPVTDNCGVNTSSIAVSPNTFSCADLGSGGSPHQAYVSNKLNGNASYLGEIGLEFSVTASNGVVINQLGAFDDQANGFKGGIPGINVGIFNKATQSVVAGLSTLVTDADPLTTGNYRVHTLSSPVTLMPGNYILVVKGYNASEPYYNRQQSGPLNPAGDGAGAITFTNAVDWGANTASGGFTYPPNSANAGNPNEYITGTFVYTLNSSNNKVVTVTATDTHGNTSSALAVVTVDDPNGYCGSATSPALVTDKITNKPTDGLLSNETLSLKAYPSPNQGQFTVELFNLRVPTVTMQILDQSGKIVEQKTIGLTGKTASLSIPVNIRNQSSGVYMIKVISAEGVKTSKVVVAH